MGEGVGNLKLYFMIGLPEERDEDVLAIAASGRQDARAARARAAQHIGRVTVSLNPFVPKPWTPFQWDPMEDARAIKRKIAMLRTALGNSARKRSAPSGSTPNRRAKRISRRWSRAAIAASARSSNASTLRDATAPARSGTSLRRFVAKSDDGGWTASPDPDFYVTRHYTHDEMLPWDFIDHHIHKWFLLSERKKAHLRASDPAVRRHAMRRMRRLLRIRTNYL